MSEPISLRHDVLDQQIVDCDRLPVGRVDDVVLEAEPGAAEVRGLLTGAEALGRRVGGGLGVLSARTARRLRRDGDSPPAVDPALVQELGSMVRLRVRFEDLPELAGLERWLSEHFVSRIPGGGDAAR